MLQEKEYQASYQAADGTTVEAVWSSNESVYKGRCNGSGWSYCSGRKDRHNNGSHDPVWCSFLTDAQGEQYVAIILGCKERAILYEEMLRHFCLI